MTVLFNGEKELDGIHTATIEVNNLLLNCHLSYFEFVINHIGQSQQQICIYVCNTTCMHVRKGVKGCIKHERK